MRRNVEHQQNISAYLRVLIECRYSITWVNMRTCLPRDEAVVLLFCRIPIRPIAYNPQFIAAICFYQLLPYILYKYISKVPLSSLGPVVHLVIQLAEVVQQRLHLMRRKLVGVSMQQPAPVVIFALFYERLLPWLWL